MPKTILETFREHAARAGDRGYYAAPAGVRVNNDHTTNSPISEGTSNSHVSGNHIDYGDYIGLSFYSGIAHPGWADNSNSTGNNPNGTLHKLDIYTAAVPVTR